MAAAWALASLFALVAPRGVAAQGPAAAANGGAPVVPPRPQVRVLLLPTLAVGRSPGGSQGPEWLGDMVGNLRQFVEEAGMEVWSAEAARAAFEQHHSTEPSAVSLEALNQWMTHAREGLRALGGADYGQAREHLQEANRFLQFAVDELNREMERAQRVLDTCLYLVRYFIEEANDVRQAARHARRCALLVPGVEPTWPMHTPETVEIFKHEQEVLAEEPPAELEVHSIPQGCNVRINGIVFGKTPFLATSLAQGTYRIQVECPGILPRGRRGRIHHMELHAGRNRLWVDAAFETAVRTDGLLRLHYPSWEKERALRVAHAREVADAIGADHVVLVTLTGDGLLLDRIAVDPAPKVVASAVVVPAPSGPRFDEVMADKLKMAFRALATGRSVRIEGDPPRTTPIEPWQPPGARRQERAAPSPGYAAMGTLNWVGLGAAAVGLGVLGYGWANWAGAVQDKLEAFSVAYPSDVDFVARQTRYLDARSLSNLLAWIGGALATAGLAVAPPDYEGGVPLWAWIGGGVGLGLVAWGVPGLLGGDVPLLQEAGCANVHDGMGGTTACVQDKPVATVGSLLVGTGLPLLALPAGYLVRSALGTEVQVSAAADGQQAMVRVSGRF